MRETAGRLNRTWLAILGVLALLLGTAGILMASGLAQGLAPSGVQPAGPGDTALPAGFQNVFAPAGAAIVLAVAAVLVGILALLWLLAQIPRRHQARTFRLHANDGIDGHTRCEPKVIAEAVETETEALPGVNSASALLRGSSTRLELNLDVKVGDRADVQDIVRRIHHDITPNLETALENPLRKVAVLVNVATNRGNDKAAVL